jgi:hypothetical protein
MELALAKRNEGTPSLLYRLLLKDGDDRWGFANSLHGFGDNLLENLTPEVAAWRKPQEAQLHDSMKEAFVLSPPGKRNIVEVGERYLL